MKRISFMMTALLLCFCIGARADNVVTISSTEGAPGDEVTVSIGLQNTDELSSLQVSIPLDENLTLVSGSGVLGSRCTSHSMTVGVKDGMLNVFIYSISMAAISGTNGEVASFKLKLGNQPSTISLTPSKLVLTNTSGTVVNGTAQAGTVTIRCAKAQYSTMEVDFGEVPIRSTYQKTVKVTNVGNADLTITDLVFSDVNVFSSTTTLPISIRAGQSKQLNITYAPVESGTISKTLKMECNSVSKRNTITLKAQPFAVNELHIQPVSGISDEEVIVSMTMNNMDAVSGYQVEFNLPEQFEYVENSFKLSARKQDHVGMATLNGNTLRIIVYSPSDKPFRSDDGVIGTFKVKLVGRNGTKLTPSKTVLSATINSKVENVVSEVYGGNISILSPQISCNNTLNFGAVSVTEACEKTLTIRNNGSSPLTISRVTFDNENMSIKEKLPMAISSQGNKLLTIIYNSVEQTAFEGTMNIYSNDPDQRMKVVKISGSRFAPNYMTVNTTDIATFDELAIDISLDNYDAITGVQFDVQYPSQYEPFDGNVSVSERATGVTVTTRQIDDHTLRCFCYSLTGGSIAAGTGKVMTLSFKPIGGTAPAGNYNVSVNNVKLGTSELANKYAGANLQIYFNVSDVLIETVNYSLSLGTGVLRITGTGEMGTSPWRTYSSYIKTVEIADGVTFIGDNAFRDCTNLTSVTIGNSVTSIGDLAFSDCSELTEVYCYAENVPNTSNNAFQNVNITNVTLIVPGSSISAYKTTTPWSGFVTIIPKVYIETDVTANFPTDWQGWNGATGFTATQFAPMVTTNDGRKVQMCEKFSYETATGDIFKRTLTGLTNGIYRIELYGSASSTKRRDKDIVTDMTSADEGDETVVYLYAKTASGTVKQYIPVHWATSFSEVATVVLNNVEITNGMVEIGMYSEKKYTNWQIVQIKGVTAIVDAGELLANTLSRAQDLLDDNTYINIIGNERTNLQQAINNNATVAEQTPTTYQNAVNALMTTMSTFTEAKGAYDKWAAAKASCVSHSYPYATEAKRNAARTAVNTNPDTAERAAAATTVYRQYAESSAMLEGVEGSTDVTDIYIVNPAAKRAIDASVWKTIRGEGSGGRITILNDQPWTDGSGNSSHSYFDGGNYTATAWDISFKQTLTLPMGRYQLTALGRSSQDVELKLCVGDHTAEMAHINATGGLFNLGWEQTSLEFELTETTTLSIGVRGKTNVRYSWMSFSDFRLVRFPDRENILIDGVYYKLNDEIRQATVIADDIKYTGDITIPETVTNGDVTYHVTAINERAFYDCSGLNSIVIPNSVISIGKEAFCKCSGLTEVYCNAKNVPYTGSGVFGNVNLNNATLYVPSASNGAYQLVAPWSEFGSIIVIALRGDANNDGKVDLDDAVFVTNIILGTKEATEEADVNKDGEIGMPDVMFIVNYIKNGKFPDEK